jgi:hypothetical protein
MPKTAENAGAQNFSEFFRVLCETSASSAFCFFDCRLGRAKFSAVKSFVAVSAGRPKGFPA